MLWLLGAGARTRWVATTLTVAVGMIVVGAAAASVSATRPASPSESAALRQAVFDYYYNNAALAKVIVTRIRVEDLPQPAPLRSRLVRRYAAITVRAFDASGQNVGYAVAIAVFYSSPAAGWHVFNDGTSGVGCDPKWYPVGQERAILAALSMTCH